MVVDLLDVLAVDWVRIPSTEFSGHYRRVVLAGVYTDDQLKKLDWRDKRGATWAIVKTERTDHSTTIYFLPV
jgi:hypothetical protein